MKKNNKVCICCEKVYTFCPNCHSINPEETWKNLWCSKNCQGIFTILSDYNSGHINKEQAKLLLLQKDISEYKSFRYKIAQTIDDILGANEKPFVEQAQEIFDKTILESEDNDKAEVETKEVEEQPKIEKKKRYRRKFVNKIK